MDNQQLAWAAELKKAKRFAGMRRTVPRALQEKQTEEELAYYKEKLRVAGNQASLETLSPILQKLISLRAKQTALRVAALKETFGSIGPTMAKPIIKKYIADCKRLLRSALPH